MTEIAKRFPDDWTPDDSGYLAGMPMEDGRWWCLMPLTLGRLRIVIAEDEFTAGEHWCFSNNAAALVSFAAGPDSPPEGWSRHMHPDGSFEYPDQEQEHA